MPTYDYQCDACEHAWELFQKITDEPIKKCPECGKRKARRLFGTGAAIMFKGSGFYETDYRSDSYKKSADADKKAAQGKSDSGSAENTKADLPKSSDKPSESKPAASSEKKPTPKKKSDD